MYVHLFRCVSPSLFVSVHVWIYLYTYIYTHIHIYIYILYVDNYVYIHVYMATTKDFCSGFRILLFLLYDTHDTKSFLSCKGGWVDQRTCLKFDSFWCFVTFLVKGLSMRQSHAADGWSLARAARFSLSSPGTGSLRWLLQNKTGTTHPGASLALSRGCCY